MPVIRNKRKLNQDEQKRLILLAAEMQARGIKIPEIPNDAISVKSVVWPLDENGYFISRSGRKFNPTPQQEAYAKSTSRFALYYGGRGSGKSCTSAQKALKKIMLGHSGMIVNPDFENFRLSTWPEFKEWIPWDMVVPSQRNRMSEAWQPTQPFVMAFVNGARVYCKGLKDPESARGPNVNWLWYDESGRDEEGLAFKLAIAGVRVGENPQVFCSQTAKPTSHWSYKFFIERDIPEDAIKAFGLVGSSLDEFIQSFHGSTEDNKDNLDPGFYASLLATYPAGALRDREIGGKYVNDGGKIGDSSLIKVVPQFHEDWQLGKKCRYWDMAGTEKKVVGGKAKNDPDESVGTLTIHIANAKEPSFCFVDQVAGWFKWDKLKDLIVQTALHDGPDTTIVIEQEPGSGGKNQVAEIQNYFKNHPVYPELKYYTVVAQLPTDRVQEANVWFGYANAGNIYALEGMWNKGFFEQVDGFTLIKHDDRVTSASGSVRYLNPHLMKTWKRVAFVGI
jgi:phage terminase large subunit-like protein